MGAEVMTIVAHCTGQFTYAKPDLTVNKSAAAYFSAAASSSILLPKNGIRLRKSLICLPLCGLSGQAWRIEVW